jgi:hypothetical protein
VTQPDTREENLRQVKDDMVRVVTEQQKKLGMLPDVGRATRFVEPVIDEQAKRTEEVLARPDSAKTEVDRPRRPSFYDEEDGKRVINRSLGSATMQADGTSVMKKPLRQRKIPPEGVLIQERLALLARMPEWHQRVMKAWDSGGPAHQRADKVMEVVEASYKVFGDPRR